MMYLVPVAFWVFVAVAVVAGAWRQIAFRREAEITIRTAIEKGQSVDRAFIDMVRDQQRKEHEDAGQGLLVGGLVVVALGIGVPLIGYCIRLSGDPDAFYPMMGTGALLFLIGIALLIGWRMTARKVATSQKPSAL